MNRKVFRYHAKKLFCRWRLDVVAVYRGRVKQVTTHETCMSKPVNSHNVLFSSMPLTRRTEHSVIIPIPQIQDVSSREL